MFFAGPFASTKFNFPFVLPSAPVFSRHHLLPANFLLWTLKLFPPLCYCARHVATEKWDAASARSFRWWENDDNILTLVIPSDFQIFLLKSSSNCATFRANLIDQLKRTFCILFGLVKELSLLFLHPSLKALNFGEVLSDVLSPHHHRCSPRLSSQRLLMKSRLNRYTTRGRQMTTSPAFNCFCPV